MAKKTSPNRPTKSAAEKRVYPRKTLRTQVVIKDETGEGFIYFYSTDISLGGIFIESDIPLALGTKVHLSFTLGEGGRMIRISGQVARLEKDPSQPLPSVGLGIQFADVTEDIGSLLEGFLTPIRG